MKRLLLVLFCSITLAQTPAPNASLGPEFAAVLNFETNQSGPMPQGWGGSVGTIFVDSMTVHSGRWATRLERGAGSPGEFSTLTRGVPIDFGGDTIEWRGFLRTEDVSGYTGLWMREDGDAGSVAFDNMQQRQIKGTRDWTEYSITLPLRSEAKQLVFGVLIAGTGRVWADDLQLLVNGKPIWEAPKVVRPKSAIDLDHEFDGRSGIAPTALTPMQVENLAMLGKVWGFLKYHHPVVTAGQRHWDYDLFRVMPKVLAAGTRTAADEAVRDWIVSLGTPPRCTSCVSLSTDANAHLTPDFSWMNEERHVGTEVAALLRTIYRERPRNAQFYVSQAPNVGNPVFDREPGYPGVRFPDAGYQLLALYRFWNIVEYWYPNRNVMDQNWNDVLAEFIPRIALARTKDEYQLEMIALIGKVTDTHANLWSAPPQLRPPAGACQLPVITRFVENRAIVTGYSNPTTGPASGIRVGDVIESVDGRPIQQLVDGWSPYYPASNQAARLRDIARGLTRGPCTTVLTGIRRETDSVAINTERLPLTSLNQTIGITHDLAGDTFRLLSNEVAYLKLSSVKAADSPSYVERAKGTKGLIIDIRNYPSEFVVFALGSLLVDRPTEFARFTVGDLDNPGLFLWRDNLPRLIPSAPHYSGKVVILVDEVSQSQAEYTAMALRTAPQAIVVGSTTAGADGNVSSIALPGGLSTMISGIGVFYPDKRPTQRVGITPDFEIRPTIAGIRAGRDEVLEEALRQILGAETPPDQILKMSR